MTIGGSWSRDGGLVVTLINGFTPVAGDTFDIFDFDAARDAGTFSTLTLPALTAGLARDTSELYTTGTLSIVSTTGLTFAAWATTNGIPGATPTGDHDADGFDNTRGSGACKTITLHDLNAMLAPGRAFD